MDGMARMQAAMEAYFAGEKAESLLFVIVGVLAIGIALTLLGKQHRLRGMAYPLIAVALIQIGVGGTVYLRTDEQVATLSAQLAIAPTEYKRAELARMEKVAAAFDLYKIVEIVLIAAGLAMVVGLRRRPTLHAAGIGLALQATLMLAADLVAEERADVYIENVRKLELPDEALVKR